MRKACMACHEPATIEGTFPAREMMFGSKDPFHYFCCPTCGTLTLLDPPTNFMPYYSPSSYYSVRDSGPLYSASWRRRLKTDSFLRSPRCIATLTDRLPKQWRLHTPVWLEWFRATGVSRSSRILDVGSGTGALLHKLAADGFSSLRGVDPFIEASLATDDGVQIVKGELDVITSSFDLVMFHHSLEHMEDPALHLTTARHLLSSTGKILLRIPVSDCWAFEHYRSDWVQLDPPRHQVLLTDDAVFRLARKCGYSVDRRYRDSSGFQIWGSELYRRDVPLSDAQPSDYFTGKELADFETFAADLNASTSGDQSVYILSPQ